MVYFLSDIHLGSKALPDARNHQDKIVTLLETLSKDATAIYLMGDIFDFWFEYFWPTRSKQHRFGSFLNELRSLTDRGIEVHFFTGNHDLWTFGQLAQMTGAIIHKKPLTTVFQRSGLSDAAASAGLTAQRSFNEVVCFLAHGDEFCWENHYQWLRRFFHCRVAQFFFRLVPPCVGDAIGFSWAAKSRRREMVEPTEYKGEANEALVQFAKEYSKTHEVDYFIFGHRHIELDLQISARTRVVILGDLFRQGTYAALDENGNLSLLNYQL
ncbi:MAG: UDP-2,3-diacylglucosamine diphosphatase [Paludibacteraceae bacterium]|nr:UDP-2,3-diacylglucosamine diphosphatase [Paludibacteraceae bacterium]